MGKRGFVVLFSLSIILILSMSIVSAGFFGDLWNKLTGKATTPDLGVSSKSSSSTSASSSSASSSTSGKTTTSPSTSASSSSSLKESGLITGNQTNQTCTDSDGGINYFVKGHVFGEKENETYDYWDFCYNNYNLKEYYCYANTTPLYTSYNCGSQGKICSNGACVLNQTQNQTGSVIDITGYTNPDWGVVDFQAITNGSINYVKFQINFNGGAWNNIGSDYTPPYIVSWSDNLPRQNVRIQATPFYNNVSGQGRTEGPFQYLGPENQTNQTCNPGDRRCYFFDEYHGGPVWWVQICSANHVWTNLEECPYGCENGFCLGGNQSNYSCADTDGGITYNKRGEVYGINLNGPFTHTDFCAVVNSSNSTFTLNEYYCNQNSSLLYSINHYECPAGCENGACKPSPNIFRTRKLKETLADFNPQIEFQQLQLRVF